MRKTWKSIRFYFRVFQRLELMNKAAGLSFYTAIAIFPLIMVLLAASQAFLKPEIVLQTLERVFSAFLPYQSDLLRTNLKSLYAQRHSVTVVGGLSLLVTGQMLYVNLERIMNSLLHVKMTRRFWQTRIWFFVWLSAMVTALFAPLALDFLFVGLAQFGIRVPFIAKFANQGAFLLLVFLMFVSAMIIVPTRRPRPGKLLFGAVMFTIATAIGKSVFRILTLKSFGRYDLVYGSLSTLVLVALWVFYFYNIFLFCVYWVGREHDPIYRESRLPVSQIKEG